MAEEETEARVLRTGAGAVVVGDSAEARDYLRKQSLLADLEIDKLRKEDEFELSHLRWRRFNDQMKGALQILTVLVGLAVRRRRDGSL